MANRPCSCIRDTFLLHVSSPAKDVVLIHDLSNWVTDEDGFVYPNFYTLDVKYPNEEVKSVEVSPIHGFMISGEKLPDGIYTFTLDNCGVTYTQKALIISSTECALDKATLKAKSKTDFELIDDIKSDIMVAQASAEYGDYDVANKILNIAKRKLESNFCNCNCK